MIFRIATLADTEAVTAIYDGAKKILRDSGIPQWQGPVPGEASFTEDVKNGAWRDSNALVAHHVAVSNECRKHGVAVFMLENAELIAKRIGKTSLRLDTHELNHRMRNLLEKCGFVNVGNVHMPNGDPRLAYEKII